MFTKAVTRMLWSVLVAMVVVGYATSMGQLAAYGIW